MRNWWKSKFANPEGVPIFVLGSGRSGTTLLQKLLNSTDDVIIWGEHGGFLKQIADSYFLSTEDPQIIQQIFHQNPRPKNPNLNFNKLKLKKIGYCWMNWYGKKNVVENFSGFIESFFKPEGLAKQYWGFKEIRYGMEDRVIEMLAELFPTAIFLFIVRDPIDVVASQVTMGWDGDWETLARKWAKQNQKILKFHDDNQHRSRLIRFESLIDNESDTIKNLFSWLGLEESKRQIDLLQLEEGVWRLRRQDGKPHRSIFSERRKRAIEQIVGEPKQALGY